MFVADEEADGGFLAAGPCATVYNGCLSADFVPYDVAVFLYGIDAEYLVVHGA